MATDISNVKRKLFGVSFLRDENNKHKVEQLWQERFSPRNSFWITAGEGETVENLINQFVQLLERENITELTGDHCILAFFVDCTRALEAGVLEMLKQLAPSMEAVMGCEIHAEIQFCYMGKLGLGSRQEQRENLRQAVEFNSNKPAGSYHRLCVVATPTLGAASTNNWKAAMVYVDLLRRTDSVTDLVPSPGTGNDNETVGYLKYEEYDEELHVQLMDKKARIERLLGNGGSDELRDLLEKKRQELMNLVNSRFVIDADLHPLHTDMVLPEGNIFNNPRNRARRGRNEEFNLAQSATRAAVADTAARMCDEIRGVFQPDIENAAALLRRMADEAELGNEAKRDRSLMHSVLNLPGIATGDSIPLVLKYDEAGYINEISNYLEYMKQVAISEGIRALSAALKEAYDAITDERLDQEKAELTDQLTDVKNELDRVPDAATMCTDIANFRDPKECQFRVGMGLSVRSSKLLLSRGDEMTRIMEQNASGVNCGRYTIRHPNGGIINPDSAPLKAMKVVYVHCTDTALQHLLREVKV